MREQARIAIDHVYDRLGVERNEGRKAEQVKIRTALGVALSKYFPDATTGNLVGRDRCTVIHYRHHQRYNVKGWVGYKEIYEVVKDIVDEMMSDGVRKSKTTSIEIRIKSHKKAITELRKQLKNLEAEPKKEKENELQD